MAETESIKYDFPLSGYRSINSYQSQPKLTTSSLLNVRPFSSDVNRARGGSRPGLANAYTLVGGTSASPIQNMYFMDYGFGDTRVYNDSFSVNGDLKDDENWTDATGNDGDPQIENGMVVLRHDYSAYAKAHAIDGIIQNADVDNNYVRTMTSGPFKKLAGDEFQDFSFTTKLMFGLQGTETFVLTVTGTNTLALTFNQTLNWNVYGTFGQGQAVTMDYLRSINGIPLNPMEVSPVYVKWEVNKTNVKFYINNRLVGSTPNMQPDAVYNAFSFTMSTQNKGIQEPTIFPNQAVWIMMGPFSLIAKSRPTTIGTGGTVGGSGSAFLQRELLVIKGNKLYVENQTTRLIGNTSVTGNSVSSFTPRNLYSTAHCNGSLYIVDGVKPTLYSPTSVNKLREWIPAVGEIEKTCTLICNWRNRLVLAGSQNDPQNWFMTRQDDPLDFSYGADDVQSAVAGNNSDCGRIGDPIVALMPYNDNYMLFGCSRSIWLLNGDPLMGGTITAVTKTAGIVSQNSWCIDGEGAMWMLTTQGLYRWTGNQFENVSASMISEFQNLNTQNSYVTLSYDSAREGILISIVPFASGVGQYWWFDLRLKGFFPESYNYLNGPTCSLFYNATGSTYRKLLFGGTNGYITSPTQATKNDATGNTSQAINSHVLVYPNRPISDAKFDGKTTRQIAIFGTGTDPLDYAIISANDMEGLQTGSTACGGTWTAGRNYARNRVRGGALGVRLHNNKKDRAWSFENLSLDITPGGIQRGA